MNNNHQNLIGAHVSIAGSIYQSISNGKRIGANSTQIFSKNHPRWSAKTISDEDAYKFEDVWQKSSIKEVGIHASYLINLANLDPNKLEKSRF